VPRKARSVAGIGFSFRWGIPVLDNLPYTILYHFLLDHYAELGVDPLEMMFIIHLSQFRHETPDGKAAPGLATIAALMGYKDEQQVRRIKHRLMAKGLLRVTPQSGFPDVYDVAPFAAAAWRLWEAEQRETPIEINTPLLLDRGIGSASPAPIESERGGLSNGIGEKEEKENIKRSGTQTVAGQTFAPDETSRYSGYITAVVLDHAKELGAATRGPQGAVEALQLWTASGLPEAAFVERLHQARAAVRKQQQPGVDKWSLYLRALRESGGGG
jgi:hypothetical protein